jgi:preprotein translocase subunit Sec61beta
LQKVVGIVASVDEEESEACVLQPRDVAEMAVASAEETTAASWVELQPAWEAVAVVAVVVVAAAAAGAWVLVQTLH